MKLIYTEDDNSRSLHTKESLDKRNLALICFIGDMQFTYEELKSLAYLPEIDGYRIESHFERAPVVTYLLKTSGFVHVMTRQEYVKMLEKLNAQKEVASILLTHIVQEL